jgi:ATP-grasp domain, R2K clade family 3
MKAFFQQNPANELPGINTFIAYEAYRQMGWEMVRFNQNIGFTDLQPENVVVGYVDGVHAALRHLGRAIPIEPNYPEILTPFLGRKIWRSTINTIANQPENWNIFVKPAEASKTFTGRVIRSTKDLIGCGNFHDDLPIWCSEIADFVTEWRCFVRYGQILDVRRYAGDWRSAPDISVIEAAVKQYQSAPAGYAIDFGLTRDGRTLLVEVNDGYAIGAYGLFYIDYAKLLSARWAEMTDSEDYCNF